MVIRSLFSFLKEPVFILLICVSHYLNGFSQFQVSANNYTGNWENPTSWEPIWNTPLTDNIFNNFTIHGYITCNSSLSITSDDNTLYIQDTLVIAGDLTLGDYNNLTINSPGILVVLGDLIIGENSNVTVNSLAYLIINGSFIKNGLSTTGSYINNNVPSSLFIGESITSGLDSDRYPVFDCPGTSPYANSNCTYGNLTDLSNDPIYPFYLTICQQSVTITSTDEDMCVNETRVLTGSSVTGVFSIEEGSGVIDDDVLTVTDSGEIIIRYTDTDQCTSTASQLITVNALPVVEITLSDTSGLINDDGVLCADDTVTLTATGGTSYIWSTGETTASITKNTAGTFNVIATDENGCANTDSADITVIQLESYAGENDYSCGLQYSLNVEDTLSIGMWSVDSDDVLTFSNEYDPNASVTVPDFGSYDLIWTIWEQGCSDSSKVSITFYEPPEVHAGADQELYKVYSAILQADSTENTTGVWTVIKGPGIMDDIYSSTAIVSGLSPGENIILWTVSTDYCSSSDSIIVQVDGLFLPQVITPNGDFKNDYFVVENIEDSRPTSLTVLNRWGSEVYSNLDYLNTWGGTNNDGVELINDTYFYVLRFNDGKLINGFVVIKR